MSSTGDRDEVRRRLLNNARAREFDRLRGEALKTDPTLAGDALDAAAKELQRVKLSEAGKKSRRVMAARLAQAEAALAVLPGVVARLVETLDYIGTATGELDEEEAVA